MSLRIETGSEAPAVIQTYADRLKNLDAESPMASPARKAAEIQAVFFPGHAEVHARDPYTGAVVDYSGVSLSALSLHEFGRHPDMEVWKLVTEVATPTGTHRDNIACTCVLDRGLIVDLKFSETHG